MELANPLALVGLASLLIPLAIHLIGQRPKPARPVGSLQLLRGRRPRRKNSLQLQQLGLLALRLLVFTLLVVGLAQPQLPYARHEETEGRILLSPALDYKANLNRFDSLRQLGYQLHWSQPGLPLASGPAPVEVDFWAGLQDADSTPDWPDSLSVLGNPQYASLAARRPALSRPVTLLKLKDLVYRTPPIGNLRALIQYNPALPADTSLWIAILKNTAEVNKQLLRSWVVADGLEIPDSIDISIQLGTSAAGPPAKVEFTYAPKQANRSGSQWFEELPGGYQFSWRADTLQQEGVTADALMQAWFARLPLEISSPAGLADPAVWMPLTSPVKARESKPEPTPAWWWLVLVILFLVERWWSLRKL